jgi:hypothetical protein
VNGSGPGEGVFLLRIPDRRGVWEVSLALSEEERRRLEELERELTAEDPGLARELSPGSGVSGTPVFLAVLAAGMGLVLLIIGLASQLRVMGVAGFLLMGVGVFRFFTMQLPGNDSR